jgi:hypothetical protein
LARLWGFSTFGRLTTMRAHPSVWIKETENGEAQPAIRGCPPRSPARNAPLKSTIRVSWVAEKAAATQPTILFYNTGMTRAQFESELVHHIDRFARCAADLVPPEEAVLEVWRVNNHSYPLGYFDNIGLVYRPPEGSCD